MLAAFYRKTCHITGVKLWGGEKFESKGRFGHNNVEDMSFSPCENYLVTYRLYDQGSYHNPNNEPIILWDARNCTKLKVFDFKQPLDIKCHVQATVVEEKAVKKGDKEDPKQKGKEPEKKKIERIMRVTRVFSQPESEAKR